MLSYRKSAAARRSLDEAAAGLLAAVVVGGAQNRRRVDGGEDGRQAGRKEGLAAILRDAKGAAEESLGGSGAEADDHFRLDLLEFGVEPGAAGGDFAGAGLLVDAALAARLPFEMLDGIGDVDVVAIDAGVGEAAIEKKSGGADKRRAFAVFTVAGLLADEDEPGG